jgi:hypothetical protein
VCLLKQSKKTAPASAEILPAIFVEMKIMQK